MADLEHWMHDARGRMSRHAEVGRAMDSMLKHWPTFTRFLNDGRICLSNNFGERALRKVALGRNSWLFCGSNRGGERAVAYSLLSPARLNGINRQAWLADVRRRITDHPIHRIAELLSRN